MQAAQDREYPATDAEALPDPGLLSQEPAGTSAAQSGEGQPSAAPARAAWDAADVSRPGSHDGDGGLNEADDDDVYGTDEWRVASQDLDPFAGDPA